jgi:hypothetical protein
MSEIQSLDGAGAGDIPDGIASTDLTDISDSETSSDEASCPTSLDVKKTIITSIAETVLQSLNATAYLDATFTAMVDSAFQSFNAVCPDVMQSKKVLKTAPSGASASSNAAVDPKLSITRPGRVGMEQSLREKSRKRQRASGGSEGNDSDDGEDRRKKQQQKKSDLPAANLSGRRLACPFFKKNPQKHTEWRSCQGPGWLTVHRVKYARESF